MEDAVAQAHHRPPQIFLCFCWYSSAYPQFIQWNIIAWRQYYRFWHFIWTLRHSNLSCCTSFRSTFWHRFLSYFCSLRFSFSNDLVDLPADWFTSFNPRYFSCIYYIPQVLLLFQIILDAFIGIMCRKYRLCSLIFFILCVWQFVDDNDWWGALHKCTKSACQNMLYGEIL